MKSENMLIMDIIRCKSLYKPYIYIYNMVCDGLHPWKEALDAANI